MRKHFLLFMALFALGGLNNLFADGEASGHTSGANVYNPESQNLTALTLPVSISSITKDNFASTVWAPAVYTRSNQSTVQLVSWSDDDKAMKFAALDMIGDGKTGNDLNNVEHPFIIKLGGAGKKVTVQTNKAKSTSEGNTGAGFKIYEWDGTQWVSIKGQTYTTNPVEANLSASTRYVMIAPYSHGGGDRILSKLDVTKFEAPTNFDATPTFTLASSEAWGQQYVNKSVSKNIKPTNLNDGAKVSNWSAEISGADAGMFSVNCDEYTGLCRVTYTPTAAGSHNATLTLTATDNEVSPSVQNQHTMELSGSGDGTAVIELTKQGEATASTSYNFGSVVGLNAATNLVLEVFKSGIDGDLAYEWKTQDAAFGYSVSGSQLTITAKPNAAQDAQSVHTGVLTVKGKSAGSVEYDVLKDFTVTLTVNPRTIPTKTWNIGTQLFERNEYSNIFTTNSDAQVTISVGNSNSYLTYANNTLTTHEIASSSQAAGSITISAPATDTYAAINEVREITLVSNPAYLPLEINNKEIFDLVYSNTSQRASWDATNGRVKLAGENGWNADDKWFDFTIKSAPFKLSFTINASTESGFMGTKTPTLKIFQRTSTGNLSQIGSDQTFNGTIDVEKELDPSTMLIRIQLSGITKDGTLSNIQVSSSSPTLTVAEPSVVMKANSQKVYDKNVQFSVLKYDSVKAKVTETGFSLVKGDAAASSEITFTSADGLNDNSTTQCSFKVCYSGDMTNVTSKTATIKFYDGSNELPQTVAVSIAPVEVLTFEKPTNGSYTYQYEGEDIDTISSANVIRELADAPYEVTLTATPTSGYKFFAWYETDGVTKTYLSTNATYTPSIETTKTIGAEFVDQIPLYFIVKGQEGAYLNLNDACTAALTSSSNIVVLASDGTLPAGDYTIPAGVTLLIPFDEAYSCYTTSPMILHGWRKEDDSGKKDAVSDPVADGSKVYRMLTLASGAHLYVYGTLSLSAKRWVVIDTGSQGTNQPNISGSGRIKDNYGCITMNSGSTIQVGDGTQAGKLYCWGRIRGEGTISVESGSEAREMFVYTDWRDNGKLAGYASGTKCFPLNQFYVQDIQVPITFHAGAKEILRTGFFNSSGSATSATDIPFIGPNNGDHLMRIASGSITKKYDIPTDRLIFDFDGDIAFYKSTMMFGGQSASTNNHIFPITNNWTININTGTTSCTYDLNLNAGAIININENATLKLKSGASLYVYDADDWVWEGSQKYGIGYCSGRRIIPLRLPSCEIAAGTYKDANNQPRYIKSTKYKYNSNSINDYDAIRLEADLTDAEIRVDGTLIVEGGNNCNWSDKKSGLYTTNGSKYGSSNIVMSTSRDNDGAKIYSTGSGQIIYNQGPGTQTTVNNLNKGTDNGDKAIVTIRPAMLKNNDGSYFTTAGYSAATTFKYVASTGKWGKVSTVTFKNGEAVVKAESLAEGEAIVPPTENPTKPGYVFGGWNQPATMGTSDIVCQAIWAAQIIDVKPETTDITADSKKTTQDNTNSTFTVSEPIDATEVNIKEGATLNVEANAEVNATTLALSATPAAFVDSGEKDQAGSSSQITGAGTVNATNAYIDITMNNSGTMNASRYYAIAVPFNVAIVGGVQKVIGSATSSATRGTDFRVYEYDGAKRAASGEGANWKKVGDQTDGGYLIPGKFYLIEFADNSSNIYRFHKAAGALLNNMGNVTLNLNASSISGSNGWNGIANNALSNASVSATGVTYAQVLNEAGNGFTGVELSNTRFAVATPMFVQTTSATQATIAKSTNNAPARLLAQTNEKTLGNYTVRIKAEGATKMADQLFISASENAANEYESGKDLAKMFIGNSSTAQLWVNNYGMKLTANQTILQDNVAEASLTLYAPKAGDYVVYLRNIPEDATIYLLENGEIKANLNEGERTVFLEKGENKQYGLRINARNIPDIITSMDEAKVAGTLQKVLLNGNVYIVREGKVYNAQGMQL